MPDNQVKDPSEKSSAQVLGDEKKRVESLMLSLPSELESELTRRILADVKNDEAARQDFMAQRQEVLDAYEGKKTPKSDPFVGCANVKTMITFMTVELLHAKMFPTCYNADLVYWVPQEKSDIQSSEKVSKFMKWDQRSSDLEHFVDDWLKNDILEGTVVSKTRWNTDFKWVQRKIPKKSSQIKRIKNVLLNLFGQKKVTKVEETDFDITYEYKKFESCVTELIPLEDVGFPVFFIPGSDENKLRHIWHRTRPFLDELKDKEAQGLFKNTSKIGSDIESKLMQSGTQKLKMEAEGSKQIDTDKENTPLELIEWYGKFDVPEMGRIEIIAWVERKTETFLGAMPLVKVSRIEDRGFTIDQFIRRTGRMYGKTLPINELENEMNSIHNQRLDAGTMSIVPMGVYRAGSGMTPEDIQVKPGLWLPVDDINDIKYLVMPNNVLVSFQEERLLMELIEKISSAGSYQSGQDSGANRSRATARGTLALISQGEQRFQVLSKRAQFGLSKILTKRLQKYQENIPMGMEERVLGEDGDQIFPEGLAPEDIAGNYDVYQTLDATAGSKSLDLQKWMTVYQLGITNPIVQSNPAYIWALSSRVLKAAEVVDVEEIIGPRPKLPTDVAKDVNEENLLMLQNKTVKTSPQDNVIQHLIGHLFFRESPQGLSMTPEARAKLDEHIDATRSQLIQQVSQMASKAPVDMMGGLDDTAGNDGIAPGVGGMAESGGVAPQGNPAPGGAGGPIAPQAGGIQGGSPAMGVGGVQ